MKLHHRELADGQRFTVDGETWHVAAVPLFGNVAVYVDDDRDPDTAITIRIDVPDDGLVTIEEN